MLLLFRSRAREDLKPERSFVVYSGKDRYSLSEDVEAVNFGANHGSMVPWNHGFRKCLNGDAAMGIISPASGNRSGLATVRR
jgi:hypothetical protein